MRIALLVLVACHASPQPHIDAARFETIVKTLSSDAFEGRAPGTPGGVKTEDYIAAQMAAIGLAPAGEGGTYFQTVPMRESRLASGSLVVGDFAITDAKLWTFGTDVNITAPLVFAGYGDDADVHGAIAAVYMGSPRQIGGKPVGSAEHAVMADIVARMRVLKTRGALAVIAIYDPVRAEGQTYEQWLPTAAGPELSWSPDVPALPRVTISEAAFDRVIGGGAHAIWEQLDRGERPKVTIAKTATLVTHADVREIRPRNVLGMIRGATDEVVVYSAHHDHLGIGVPVKGDAIYNGALDNASGVAGILEIARAFRATKPRRSILFLATTGEEKGMVGSDYFAAHPTVPIDKIVADVNIDGVSPLYEPFDIVALGIEHSTLAAHAEDAARKLGLSISPDPDPGQVYFIRSDQYSFVKRGIPSAFPDAGHKDRAGNTDENTRLSDLWGGEHYHAPSDVWQPTWDARWAAKVLAFDFEFGLSIANAPERPRWNPGSPFATSR